MLSNNTLYEPPLNRKFGKVTVSLYVDNWSPYNLVMAGNAIVAGSVDQEVAMPASMAPQSRELAVRSSSKNERTAGLLAWTLTDKDGVKPAQLTVAWDVGNGRQSRFSISLGNPVPGFSDMWNGAANRPVSDQLDDTIYAGGGAIRMLAVANMTMNEGDILHYRLRVALVPAKIDVWGWVKYFREPAEAAQRAIQASNDVPSQKSQGQPRPNQPLFERKELLANDSGLASLVKANMTLRRALAALSESIAMGIQVENWSTLPMGQPQLEILSGTTQSPAPGSVAPGSQNVGIISQAKAMTGTNGVIRWTLGSTDRVLSLMWSVPYNRQLWRTWLAVGLTSHTDLPSYKEMYEDKDNRRFYRSQSGHRFEFSDGQFIVIVRMDGDSTFKPVLHLGLAPIDTELLAPAIRKKLGLKPSVVKNPNDLLGKSQQKRQQQQQQQGDMPSVGLVQSTTGGGGGGASGALKRTQMSLAVVTLCYGASIALI